MQKDQRRTYLFSRFRLRRSSGIPQSRRRLRCCYRLGLLLLKLGFDVESQSPVFQSLQNGVTENTEILGTETEILVPVSGQKHNTDFQSPSPSFLPYGFGWDIVVGAVGEGCEEGKHQCRGDRVRHWWLAAAGESHWGRSWYSTIA
ncbi:hypothetical protein PIB30_085472 [Stylosanthes scabra]|uniref:Uncharacterized protein n=1 Tax=Stylosanthes scabra TaxID=79078 RepID=A0ABU6RSS7_9FABA|nr:hypothetical protein [Stylosanthes scabra]